MEDSDSSSLASIEGGRGHLGQRLQLDCTPPNAVDQTTALPIHRFESIPVVMLAVAGVGMETARSWQAPLLQAHEQAPIGP
eukprot:365644-Chlamydomonas_euryale.AAC.5